MPQSTQNVRIGIVEAFLNEVSLGHTLGATEFEFGREVTRLKVDKYGTSTVDVIIVGHEVKLKLMLAEMVESILTKLIPEGAYTIVGSDDKLGFGRTAGTSLKQYARLLRLHPVRNIASDRSEDIYIHLAVHTGNVKLPYAVDTQSVIEANFEGLIDETQPDGTLLGRIGDQDVS